MKTLALCLLLLVLASLALAAQNAPASRATSDQATYHVSLNASHDSSSIIGKPTISAAFIDQVLRRAGSPARGTGEALYRLGVQYGIDPVFALAFFHHESSYGTTGEARVTRSLGNERCIEDRPCTSNGYAVMRSWIDGYEHWYSLLLYGYVQGKVTLPIAGHTCSTIEQIIPVYAPASDHNDEQAYISAVEQDVAQWRAGQ